jgi:hypothetical protein
MSQNIPHFQPLSVPVDAIEDVQPKRSMNTRQKLAVILLDVLMLIELAVAIAWASKHQDSFTPMFMKTFFLMFLPTLALGIHLIRKLGRTTSYDHA